MVPNMSLHPLHPPCFPGVFFSTNGRWDDNGFNLITYMTCTTFSGCIKYCVVGMVFDILTPPGISAGPTPQLGALYTS